MEKKNEGDVKWEKGLCVFNSEGNHESGTAQVLLTYYSHITEILHRTMAKQGQSKDKARVSLCPACTNRFSKICVRPASLMSKVYGKSMFGRRVLAAVALVVMMGLGVTAWGQTPPPASWGSMTDGAIYTLDCGTTYTITENTTDANKYVRFQTDDGCKIKVTLVSRTFNSGGGRYDELYINNGNTGTSESGTNWYGNTYAPIGAVFASTGSEVTVYYHNGHNNNSSFQIRVECTCPPENSTCIDFEDGFSFDGWSYGVLNGNLNNNYIPNVYTDQPDGNGLRIYAGNGTGTTHAVQILPDIADIQRGGTMTFNAWWQNTGRGTLRVGYLVGTTIYWFADPVTPPTAIDNASWATGQYSVTIPNDMPDGAQLVFGWEYSSNNRNSYVVIDNICIPIEPATPHHLYYKCADNSSPSNIDDVYAVAATVTSEVPNCSSNCFLGWSTTPGGSVVYTGGESIDLRDNDVTLYAKYNSTPISLTIPNAEISGGYCYVNACAGNTINGDNNKILSPTVSGLATPLTYQWIVNDHVSESPDTTTGETCTIATLAQMGYDVRLTVTGSDGCKASLPIRVRVSKGVNPVGTVPTCFDDMADPPICVGESDTIFLSEPDGQGDFTIDEPSINIYATLGKGETTFIPDGECNGTRCYESTVTFDQFPDGAEVTGPDDIKFLRIKMEHSYFADAQIKLICPNGSEVMILPDLWRGGVSLDEDTYTWPYRTMEANGQARYRNGNRWEYVNYTYYVVYNNGVYSLTRNADEATVFFGESPTDEEIQAAANSLSLPDWNENGRTYQFYSITSYTRRLRAIGMGVPNLSDGDASHICDPGSNEQGTGWDYCWSNSTVDGYEYAEGGGIMWNSGNMVASADVDYVVKASEMSSMSQIYQPYEDFFPALDGCPLNGTWKVKVCDGYEGDNGYVFDWSLGLSSSIMPSLWSFDVNLEQRDLSCSSVHYDGSSYDGGIIIKPEFGDQSSGDCDHPDAGGNCHLLFTDNYGCQTEISTVIKFAFDSTWVVKKSGNEVQSFCYGGNMSAVEYVYGGTKTDAVNIKWWKEGAGAGDTARYTVINSTTNGTTQNLSDNARVRVAAGNNSPAAPLLPYKHAIFIEQTATLQPGVYHYEITAQPCASGCEHCKPNTKTGTITVWEVPTVNAGDDQLICNGSPASVTLTASGDGGSGVLTYTWTPGPLSGASVTVEPATTTTYTVTAADEHCSATDQVQVSVSHLDAEIIIDNL